MATRNAKQTGESRNNRLSSNLGIKHRLALAFGVAALLTVLAGGVGLLAASRIETAFSEVVDRNLPTMNKAQELATGAAEVAGTAPELAAADSGEARAEGRERVEARIAAVRDHLEALRQHGVAGERIAGIAETLSSLEGEMETLDDAVARRLDAGAALTARLEEARKAHKETLGVLGPRVERARGLLLDRVNVAGASLKEELDTLLSGNDTVTEDLRKKAQKLAVTNDDRISDIFYAELGTLRSLLSLRAVANHAEGLLAAAATTSDPEKLKEQRRAFRMDAQMMQMEAGVLDENVEGTPLEDAINAFMQLAMGEDGVFGLRKASLDAMQGAHQSLDNARAAAMALREHVDTLVENTRGEVAAGTGMVDRTLMQSELALAGIAGGSLLICLLIAWLYGWRSIGGRLLRLTEATDAVAAGHYDTTIQVRGSDEIAAMAKTLMIFRDNLAEGERAQEREAKMRVEAGERRQREMRELADTFESQVLGMVQQVTDGAGRMNHSAQDMARMAEETRTASEAAGRSTEAAKGNVETVAGATEELSGSISEVSQRVDNSAEIAQRASKRAEETTHTMEELKSAAERIGEVVGLIKDVAEQTNLLALNATIEAARAGDAGKGFAVVANEVKSLANQTTKATEDISARIDEMQRVSGNAAQAIADINKIVSEIDETTQAIASAVEQQSSATAEIARNAQEAAEGTQTVSESIASVDKAVDQTSDGAKAVVGAAEEMGDLSQSLRKEVDRFLENVRAA